METKKRWSLAILWYKYFQTNRWLLRSPHLIRQPWGRRKPETFLPFIRNTSNRISRVLLKKHQDSGCTLRKFTGLFRLVKDNPGLQCLGTFEYRMRQSVRGTTCTINQKSIRNTTAVLGCTKPWIGLAEHNRLGHRIVLIPKSWPENQVTGKGWQLKKIDPHQTWTKETNSCWMHRGLAQSSPYNKEGSRLSPST